MKRPTIWQKQVRPYWSLWLDLHYLWNIFLLFLDVEIFLSVSFLFASKTLIYIFVTVYLSLGALELWCFCWKKCFAALSSIALPIKWLSYGLHWVHGHPQKLLIHAYDYTKGSPHYRPNRWSSYQIVLQDGQSGYQFPCIKASCWSSEEITKKRRMQTKFQFH